MTIRFDRPFAMKVALVALCLLWPVMVFGHAAYFPDTASYYRGGDVAVHFVAERLLGADHAESSTSSTQPRSKSAAVKVAQDARGARSIPYSVMTYALAGPARALGPLVVMHALMAALCVVALLTVAQVQRRAFAGSIATIAIATPAAWFIGFAMPDILAAVTILGMALLYCEHGQMSRLLKAALFLATTFAITAHTSHVGIALALFLVMATSTAWKALRRGRPDWYGGAWAAALVGLAIIIVVASGFVGFGEISIAAKRYPFALGRTLDDEAMRRDLETLCRRQSLTICKLYPHGLPRSGYDFLWGTDGVAKIASTQQMEQLRREEQPILLHLARASPAETGRHVLGGFFEQLVTFGLQDVDYESHVAPDADQGIIMSRSAAGPLHGLAGLLERLSWASVLAAVLILLVWARPANPRWRLTVIVIAGLMANAAICATFSAVAGRYQARVVWLLPLCAAALLFARKASKWEEIEE
jgi:hypothetical protein